MSVWASEEEAEHMGARCDSFLLLLADGPSLPEEDSDLGPLALKPAETGTHVQYKWPLGEYSWRGLSRNGTVSGG